MTRRGWSLLGAVSIASAILGTDMLVGAHRATPIREQRREQQQGEARADQPDAERKPFADQTQKHAQAEHGEREEEAIARRTAIATEETAAATWGLYRATLVAVAAAAMVGVGQIYLLWRQARISAAVANLERAWLLVDVDDDPSAVISDPAHAATDENAAAMLMVPLYVENVGRSPAWIEAEGIAWFWTELPIPKDRALPELEPAIMLSRGAIAPGKRVDELALNVVLEPAERQAMLAGKAAVVVYGQVMYRDPLRRPRHTSFAFTYRRQSTPSWNETTGEWAGAAAWDDAIWIITRGPDAYARQT